MQLNPLNLIHKARELPFIVDEQVAQNSQSRNTKRQQRVSSRVRYVGALKSQADELEEQTKKLINKLLES